MMPSLDSIQKTVEWAISGLCLVGSAALLLQQDWTAAGVIFAFGLVITPSLNANNILKACLTLLAFVVIFGR